MNNNSEINSKPDNVDSVEKLDNVESVEKLDDVDDVGSVDDIEVQISVELKEDPIVHCVSCLKQLTIYCFKLFFLMFTAPLLIMESTKEEKSRFPMIFWGIMHLFIIIATTMIYIPVADKYVSLDAKLVLGGFVAILVATTILMHTILTFAINKAVDKTTSFKQVLSYFTLATVPVSALIIIAFLLDFVFIPIAIAVYILAHFSWLLLSLKATEVACGNKKYGFWLYILNTILSLVVTIGIVILIGVDVCKYFLNDLVIHLFSIENIVTFLESLDLFGFIQ